MWLSLFFFGGLLWATPSLRSWFLLCRLLWRCRTCPAYVCDGQRVSAGHSRLRPGEEVDVLPDVLHESIGFPVPHAPDVSVRQPGRSQGRRASNAEGVGRYP